MSISKQQAEALAEGFLDNLGPGKEGLPPRNTFTEIILIAGELVEDAQWNLNKTNSIASGSLSESIVALEPQLNGGVLSIDIEMNYYGKFINKGVRGTQGGVGQYVFKYDNPSRKH